MTRRSSATPFRASCESRSRSKKRGGGSGIQPRRKSRLPPSRCAPCRAVGRGAAAADEGLGRSIHATLIKWREGSDREELRLLPQPVYRYESEDPEVQDGGVFAFVQGTDPEVLLLLEAVRTEGGLVWIYGFVRGTRGFSRPGIAVSSSGPCLRPATAPIPPSPRSMLTSSPASRSSRARTVKTVCRIRGQKDRKPENCAPLDLKSGKRERKKLSGTNGTAG